MTAAAPVVLTMVMAWGPVPAGRAEPPPAEAPPPASEAPVSQAPAPVAPHPAHVSSSPRFDSSPTPTPPVTYVESPPELRWYGWQLLLSDIGSIVLMTWFGTPVGVVVGAGGLTLGAPALHLANHNYGTAAASLAVRGGVALAIVALTSDRPPPCAQGDPLCPVGQLGGAALDAGVAVGLLLGGIVFAIVDDTLLARARVPRPRGDGLSALVAPQAGGLSLGLGGKF